MIAMKTIIFVLIILLNMSSISHAQDVRNGYIIDKYSYVFGYTIEEDSDNLYRFTPTIEEIKKAEAIIISNRTLISSQPNAQSGKNIFRNYKKYFRQYVGIINNEGEKLILINFVHKSYGINNSNKKELITVLDGGNSYWQAIVNVNQETLIYIQIN